MVAVPQEWLRIGWQRFAPGRGPGTDTRLWRPGYRDSTTGMQRITSPPLSRYTTVVSAPIAGAQRSATIGASGSVTLSVGPTGYGVFWSVSNVSVSTSVGAADTSTVACYIGAVALANLQGGTSYAGGGDNISLSAGALSTGDLIICVWSGGTPGSVASMNVYGTLTALA